MNFDDYDLQGQATDLATRKAMIDALLQKAAKPQIGHAIMGLFGAGPEDRAKPLQEAYQRDSAAHNQRYQGQMGQELGSYMDKMQGAPARPPSPDYEGNAVGPAVPAQAPNPREAIVRAMTSQLPEMQAMGKASMSAFGKPEEFTPHVIGNQLVFTNKQGGTKEGGTYNKADWVDEDKIINGVTTPGQRNKQDNQWMPRSGSGTTVNLDTKGQGKLQDVALKAMEDSRGQVINAQRQLDAAQRVLALSEDPEVMTGFGANAITGVAALGAKLGLNGPDGVAKTQALMTDLSQKTLDAGQQMKGSFSDSDIKFLTDVAAGKVDYNVGTIQHMALLAYTAGHNTLQNALGQYEGAKTVKGLEGADKAIPLPKVSYDAKISDRPGFRVRDGGYLAYEGMPGRAKAPGRVNAQGRKIMSLEEFNANY